MVKIYQAQPSPLNGPKIPQTGKFLASIYSNEAQQLQ